MTQILRFWRDKPLEEKKAIMKANNITKILYADIKRLYLERRK